MLYPIFLATETYKMVDTCDEKIAAWYVFFFVFVIAVEDIKQQQVAQNHQKNNEYEICF